MWKDHAETSPETSLRSVENMRRKVVMRFTYRFNFVKIIIEKEQKRGRYMRRKKIGPALILKSDDVFAKSNQIIRGKNTLSLLEEKTFTMAVLNAKAGYSEDLGTDTYVSYVSPADVFLDRKITKSGTYYTKLKEISSSLLAQTIVIEPSANEKSFEAMNIFSYCSYDDSAASLKCVFNPVFARKELMEPVKNFTRLSKSVLMSFKKAASYKLYQNLRSYCYAQHELVDEEGNSTGKYKKEYDIKELKSVFSLAEIGAQKTKKTKKNYERYTELKRNVIQPSVDEINSASDDMTVEYVERKGAHGVVLGVIFTVTLNSKAKKCLGEEAILELCDKLDDMISIALSVNDKKAILEVAEYDVDKVYEKCSLMPKSGVKNPTAWIISAIKKDYQAPDGVTAKEEDEKKLSAEKISDMQEHFESLWNKYPMKRGKSRITTTDLFQMSVYGWEQMERAEDRYIAEVEAARESGFQRRYQLGSTFFTSGYKDYLDDTYNPDTDQSETKSKKTKSKNKFINFEQTEVDYDEIAKKKVAKRMSEENRYGKNHQDAEYFR